MNETDLLPCPFCGSDAVVARDFTGLVRYWSVQCKNEDCLARSGYHLKARSAMEQWNKRARNLYAEEEA